MNNKIIIIGMTIIVISIIIYIFKNFETILNYYQNKKDKKLIKYIRIGTFYIFI